MNRKQFVTGKLPRPAHIWVYDFSATAADIPANSAMNGLYAEPSKPQTAEEIAAGRKLGAQIAGQLVQEIQAMGLPAMRASTGTAPQINDIVIRGHLISINEGSAAERVTIGFGAGESRLRTAVDGFQMTAQGLRRLGMGTVEAGGGKTPGMAMGAAVFIARANPMGLIVGGAMNAYQQESGKSTVQGRVQQTAKEIAAVLKMRFQKEGWIQ
jgi:hypothetical protein